MTSASDDELNHSELAFLYAMRALSVNEVPVAEAHISACAECQQEIESLRPVIDSLVAWPADLLRPSASLEKRLAQRIAAESGGEALTPAPPSWMEPEWKEVASGISCKLLSTDPARGYVTMMVRLAPGGQYPSHFHAGTEELHLLEGELWIDDRKLYPGDYNRGEPGAVDRRVWSETGCTCVLLTSIHDTLF